MDTQTVYMVLDIIFTPLFDDATSQMLDVNTSKPIWVKADLAFVDGQPVYPTLAVGIVSPFVVTADGYIIRCTYNPEVEGVQVFGSELDIIDSICLSSNGHDWNWKTLARNQQVLHKIMVVYKGLESFRDRIAAYPNDNNLLRMIIKDAELEL